MQTTECSITYQKIVLRVYPNAIAHRNPGGGPWRIHYRVPIRHICPHCESCVDGSELSLNVLGSGPNERSAWKSAANRLLKGE